MATKRRIGNAAAPPPPLPLPRAARGPNPPPELLRPLLPRLLEQAIEVDPAAPYWRTRPQRLQLGEDEGVWEDLAPSVVKDGQLESVGAGDLRGMLDYLGARKGDWYRAGPRRRRSVIRALRAVQAIHHAVRAVLESRDDELRARAAKFLDAMLIRVEDAQKDTRGFLRADDARLAHERDSHRYKELRDVLTDLRREGESAKREHRWPSWRKDAASRVNVFLREYMNVGQDVCTPRDIDDLDAAPAAELAAKLLKALDKKFSEERARRSARRSRPGGRTRKKPS